MQFILNLWTYCSNLGVWSGLPQREIRITKIINRFSFSLLFIVLFSFVYQAIKHLILSGVILPESLLMLPSFLPFALVFYFNQKRKYFLARLLFILHPLVNTLFWMFASNSQISNIHYSYLLFPIPIVILFKEIKTQLFLISLVFLVFVLSHLIVEFVPPLIITHSNPIFPIIIFGIWILLSFVMLRFFIHEMDLAQNKLEQKNIELQEFAQIASHDLKEPLRTINSFSRLIKMRHEEELSDDVLEYLGFIDSSIERMTNLLKDLSEYSKLDEEKQQLEPVDLNVVFNNVVQDLRHRVQESGATVSSDKLPVVNANPHQMMQLFQNLINNGIKFQPIEGNQEPEIFINSESHNEYYVIGFQDNGIGIPEEFVEKVFSKFKRLHNQSVYEGTGLGLATCKKIVESHKGFIKIDSEINKGTLIKVHLMK